MFYNLIQAEQYQKGYSRLQKSCNKQAEQWKTIINLQRMNRIVFPKPFLLFQTQ